MKTFNDLVFEKHRASIPENMIQVMIDKGIDADSDVLKPMTQAHIKFDNGHTMSIVFGAMFHSNGLDTYEAYSMTYENEPRGYLTINQLNNFMEEVQNLEQYEGKEKT